MLRPPHEARRRLVDENGAHGNGDEGASGGTTRDEDSVRGPAQATALGGGQSREIARVKALTTVARILYSYPFSNLEMQFFLK